MAKEGWKVKAIAVTITADGKRVERPFSDFSPEERRETALRMNDRALRAAGYYPVEKSRKSRSRAAGAGKEKKGVMAYG